MFLSAVSCKWGWRPQQQGVRRGREAATGRPRDRVGRGVRAGREAAASSRLQDYSVRHAPRPSSVRGEWVLGVCGAGSGFSCGSQGLWSQLPRASQNLGYTTHLLYHTVSSTRTQVQLFRALHFHSAFHRVSI
ncbi:large ribosomal subunit protein bL33m isoform X1 [Equus przewalskii]|uniref:Large ribosomal subunit protein bL33m isoform X1 n=1 Tax=Equus przewalskii TaxID=9798 RepID=A0ABM4KLK7_EQUPR